VYIDLLFVAELIIKQRGSDCQGEPIRKLERTMAASKHLI